jgi:hypothetical protein
MKARRIFLPAASEPLIRFCLGERDSSMAGQALSESLSLLESPFLSRMHGKELLGRISFSAKPIPLLSLFVDPLDMYHGRNC